MSVARETGTVLEAVGTFADTLADNPGGCLLIGLFLCSSVACCTSVASTDSVRALEQRVDHLEDDRCARPRPAAPLLPSEGP